MFPKKGDFVVFLYMQLFLAKTQNGSQRDAKHKGMRYTSLLLWINPTNLKTEEKWWHLCHKKILPSPPRCPICKARSTYLQKGDERLPLCYAKCPTPPTIATMVNRNGALFYKIVNNLIFISIHHWLNTYYTHVTITYIVNNNLMPYHLAYYFNILLYSILKSFAWLLKVQVFSATNFCLGNSSCNPKTQFKMTLLIKIWLLNF